MPPDNSKSKTEKLLEKIKDVVAAQFYSSKPLLASSGKPVGPVTSPNWPDPMHLGNMGTGILEQLKGSYEYSTILPKIQTVIYLNLVTGEFKQNQYPVGEQIIRGRLNNGQLCILPEQFTSKWATTVTLDKQVKGWKCQQTVYGDLPENQPVAYWALVPDDLWEDCLVAWTIKQLDKAAGVDKVSVGQELRYVSVDGIITDMATGLSTYITGIDPYQNPWG